MVLKDLQAVIGISTIVEFPAPQSLVDFRQNAKNYEALAANSYDERFIVTNLLCALGCLRNAQNEQTNVDETLISEIKRIEGLLAVLNTPLELGFAFRYLFLGFEVQKVPFSIHHPRFYEVLNDLSRTVNEKPDEVLMAAVITKWVNTFKESKVS